METTKEKINRKRGEYTRKRRKAYLSAKNAFVYRINKSQRSEKESFVNDNIIDNKSINNMYSYKKTLTKSAKSFIVMVLSLSIGQIYFSYPEIMGLTLGGVLIALLDYLKHNWGLRV